MSFAMLRRRNHQYRRAGALLLHWQPLLLVSFICSSECSSWWLHQQKHCAPLSMHSPLPVQKRHDALRSFTRKRSLAAAAWPKARLVTRCAFDIHDSASDAAAPVKHRTPPAMPCEFPSFSLVRPVVPHDCFGAHLDVLFACPTCYAVMPACAGRSHLRCEA
jgi:hypothetical protein